MDDGGHDPGRTPDPARLPGAHVLESGHSRHQRFDVWETRDFGRLYRLDGVCMASERDEFLYHESLVHLPLLTQPAPQRALILGGGDGGSAREILKHPSIDQVVLVELDAEVVRIAHRWLGRIHRGVFDQARLQVHIGDGLRYVRDRALPDGERFDLVVMDLTGPDSGAAELYGARFLGELRQLLTPQGAITLHLGSPFHGAEPAAQLLARLRGHFAVVRHWFVDVPLYGGWWGFACAAPALDPATLDAATLDARLVQRGIADLKLVSGAVFPALFDHPPELTTGRSRTA